jgi:hypothetical protein
MGSMAALPPFGAMLDYPVSQSPFEADIMAGLLGLEPLVFHDFLALCLKFAVQRRFLDQVVAIRRL